MQPRYRAMRKFPYDFAKRERILLPTWAIAPSILRRKGLQKFLTSVYNRRLCYAVLCVLQDDFIVFVIYYQAGCPLGLGGVG
jgi:hypothetical protein